MAVSNFSQPFNFQSSLSRFLPIVQQLQGSLGLTPFQQSAIDTQRQTRGNIDKMFAHRLQEMKGNVGQALQGKVTQGREALAERGVPESVSNLLGDLGTGQMGSLVSNQLRSSLLGQKLPHMLGISKDISGLLSGATDVNTRLLSSLLGQSGSFFPTQSGFTRSGVNVVGGGGGESRGLPGEFENPLFERFMGRR